jgi:hypothetical protein
MSTLVTLDEVKTYLGKTGTDDDVLIASVASNASAMAERDTGRIFAVASNVTLLYSTDGQRAITIHDHPYNDTTRTIRFNGAVLTEGTNVWFLQDRRNPSVAVIVQLAPFTPEWFVHNFNWFDANMDSPRYLARITSGMPNDLEIAGTVGHPVTPPDVKQAVLELAGWLYWRAKGGASGVVDTVTGTEVDVTLLPMAYQVMVRNWRIRTAVAGV